jgi:hypothetical protein
MITTGSWRGRHLTKRTPSKIRRQLRQPPHHARAFRDAVASCRQALAGERPVNAVGPPFPRDDGNHDDLG